MTKAADAFRTISEVAEALGTPAHVLRFWESKFPQLKPVKMAGGRRYYRPGDVALLAGIKVLLHEQGLTIRGVQKILREDGVKAVAAVAEVTPEAGASAPARKPVILRHAAETLPAAEPRAAPAPVTVSPAPSPVAPASAPAPAPATQKAEAPLLFATLPDQPAPPPPRPVAAVPQPAAPVLLWSERLRAGMAPADTAALVPLLARAQALRDRLAGSARR